MAQAAPALRANARPPTWTEACWRLLLSDVPRNLAANVNPKLIKGLLSLKGDLAASARPADPEAVVALLRRLAGHYPITQRGEVEERMRWQDWLDDLAGVPGDILADGCDLWRRSINEFFPTPGQMLAIVHGPACTRIAAAERIAELDALVGASIDELVAHGERGVIEPYGEEASLTARRIVERLTKRFAAPEVRVSPAAVRFLQELQEPPK